MPIIDHAILMLAVMPNLPVFAKMSSVPCCHFISEHDEGQISDRNCLTAITFDWE